MNIKTGFSQLGKAPNGWRYPLVDGTGQRYFAGTSSKPHKLLENAQTPTSRVHAVLGSDQLLLFCASSLSERKLHIDFMSSFEAFAGQIWAYDGRNPHIWIKMTPNDRLYTQVFGLSDRLLAP